MPSRKRRFGSIPCFYGNWCGPGCSGPEPPIDEIDRCCMMHDKCYRKRGYFACSCDKKLVKCLKKHLDRTTEKGRKAYLMYLYFRNSICDPKR
ncbi:phospholipase [Brevibacillus sp. WF146]|uniref:phospholipase A2 family protein n=1 Tax=Brevibacillus sp. WF146 TaxID=319501 RepID=UPI0007ED0AB1|nr:phospholipase A2 family protein [Brevibacillus sp. WF146]UYZ11576.1 phospholipase [Brevibacillus sp. WF146]